MRGIGHYFLWVLCFCWIFSAEGGFFEISDADDARCFQKMFVKIPVKPFEKNESTADEYIFELKKAPFGSPILTFPRESSEELRRSINFLKKHKTERDDWATLIQHLDNLQQWANYFFYIRETPSKSRK